MAYVAFDGAHGNDLDVAAAVVALREAGYEEVRRMPSRYIPILGHPRDDFIEATIKVPEAEAEIWSRAVSAEVEAIVDPYGGSCAECYAVEADYKPFSDTFRGADYEYGLEPAA
jgi:hypothetical protein